MEAKLKTSRVIFSVKPQFLVMFCVFMREKSIELKKFPGCLMFGVYRDISDEFTFLIYEEWDSAESFAAYRGSLQFYVESQKIFPWMIGKADATHFSVRPSRLLFRGR